MVEIRTGHGEALVIIRPSYLEVGFRHLQRTVGAGREFATIGEAVAANMRSMGCPADIAGRAGQRMQRQHDGTVVSRSAELDPNVMKAAYKIVDEINREKAAKIAALVRADKAAGLL